MPDDDDAFASFLLEVSSPKATDDVSIAVEDILLESQDVETDRILSNQNPLKILKLSESSFTKQQVNHNYRKISRLIHPDKSSHPAANDAFMKLKKALDTLLEKSTSIESKSDEFSYEDEEEKERKAAIQRVQEYVTNENKLRKLKKMDLLPTDGTEFEALVDEEIQAFRQQAEESAKLAEYLAKKNADYLAQQQKEKERLERQKILTKRKFEGSMESRANSWRTFNSSR
jgi:DnaJ homolog subfamily C member 8